MSKKHRRGSREPKPSTGTLAAASQPLAEPEKTCAPALPVDPYTQAVEAAKSLMLVDDWEGAAQVLRSATVPECDQNRIDILVQRTYVYRYCDLDGSPVTGSHLASEDQARVLDALDQLADLDPGFYESKYVDLYLRFLPFKPSAYLRAFDRVLTAFNKKNDFDMVGRLRKLRNYILRMREGEIAVDLDDAEHKALKAAPELDILLSTAYADMATHELSEMNRIALMALKAELTCQMTEEWNHEDAARHILAIPAPTVEQIRIVRAQASCSGSLITPNEWAFLYELKSSCRDQFGKVLDRYQDDFACGSLNGLRHLCKCLDASADDLEIHLQLAAELLTGPEQIDCAPEAIYYRTESGEIASAPIWPMGLQVPSASEAALRIAESVPDEHPVKDRMLAIHEASRIRVNLFEDPSDPEEEPGPPSPYSQAATAAFDWLATQSLDLHFLSALTAPRTADRVRLLLGAVLRAARHNLPLPSIGNTIWKLPSASPLSSAEATAIVAQLSQIATQRSEFTEDLGRSWMYFCGPVFKMLCIQDKEVLAQACKVSRLLADDLIAYGQAFRLGYLEHVAGDPCEALINYLIALRSIDVDPQSSSTISNCRILIGAQTGLDVVTRMVSMLSAPAFEREHSEVIASLLAEATKRRDVLQTQSDAKSRQQRQLDNHLKTAVNRWPKLSAPARQVLGVLALVDTYSGTAELASMAGMTEEWASKHLATLIREGMIIKDSSTFEVNPHIAPLIERESQHAVTGRIIRAKGANADQDGAAAVVKQVFNSNLEFSIYQVVVQLCPNHLVFPNCSLQSFMSYESLKGQVSSEDFSYYLLTSVDILVVSSTTYLPMLAIEVDSPWHDTDHQLARDAKKDRLFEVAGVPFLRLRKLGQPTPDAVRAQVAEHLDELVRTLRADIPGFNQAKGLLQNLAIAGPATADPGRQPPPGG